MSSVPHEPLADARRARPFLLRALARWFRAERRDLPWRRTRDPYAIWVSEAMLQQTRVEVVIPYYLRFLARFPDVSSLAAAEEEEVLAQWSGLGYYSRARALRAAARLMVEQHGGQVPRTLQEWLALPGVGPYTAGAVLSIAFSASEALVDGNVQRVFARLFALESPRGTAALSEESWRLARLLVPGAGDELDPGDWNQALMELGARVCTPRSPGCPTCPVNECCQARARSVSEEFPRAAKRSAPIEVKLEIFVVRSRAGFLCVRRPAGGRMAGMLEFPTRELVPAGAEPRLWPAATDFVVGASPPTSLGSVSHAITRHRIRASVLEARLEARENEGDLPRTAGWYSASELRDAALTGLARKVLALPNVREVGADSPGESRGTRGVSGALGAAP